MKRTILKTIVAVFAITLLFSSCLGDNDNTMKSDNVLSYIKTTDGGSKYAVGVGPNSIQFAGGLIDRLNVNRFYFLNYDVSTNNMSSDGIFQANSVSFKDEEPVARGDFRIVSTNTSGEPMYKLDAKNLHVIGAYPDSRSINDHWVFRYTCEAYPQDIMINTDINDPNYGENNIKLIARLYQDKQKLSDGTDLPYNQAIVHVSLERRRDVPIEAGSKKVSFPGKADIHMVALRSFHFSPNFPESENQIDKDRIAAIQFRYSPYTKDENAEVKEISLGDFTSTPGYYMYIDKSDL